MVKQSGFWSAQGRPTVMHLHVEEHDPTVGGEVAFWWWMEEAAEESPYELEITAPGYFTTKEEAHEDALDFAESHNFVILDSGDDLSEDA